MINQNLLKIIILLLIILSRTSGFTAERAVRLTGMKIFSEIEIKDKLSTARKPFTKQPSSEIIEKIKNFYTGMGYALIKIYIIKNSREELSLYIDEGGLNRVVFLNINSLQILKLKYRYSLPENIYNIKKVQEIAREIKAKEKFSTVKYRLIPSEKYDESFFQLDRKLNIPLIGETQIPFLNEYGKRFHLEFHLSKESVGTDVKKKAISIIT